MLYFPTGAFLRLRHSCNVENDALRKEPVCLSPHWIITAMVTLSPYHQQTTYTWQRYNTLTHASSSITIHAHARHMLFVLLLNFGAYLSPNYQKSCLINFFLFYWYFSIKIIMINVCLIIIFFELDAHLIPIL